MSRREITLSGEPYVYAMGWRKLTPLYDRFMRAFMPESELHAAVVERLKAAGARSVLDLGCGTGTLALRIASELPAARVAGVDGDPEILAIAREKRRNARRSVELRLAPAQKLPFGEAAFDAVVTSLVFHHLGPEGKRSALSEVRRVLRPGGRLLLMDLGPPGGRLAAAATFVVSLIEDTAENVRGALPVLMREAGFGDVAERYARDTVGGTVRLYEGSKP